VSVLDENKKVLTLTLNEQSDGRSVWAVVNDFLYQGVYNILIGLDHILFLAILLLSICLQRRDNKWFKQDSILVVSKRAFWIVTSFTLAHSITLSGTALGLIPSFGSWVEVVIALSILATALNIVYPFTQKIASLSFGFGLIHGMGFAGALGELGISQSNKVASVLAFNMGVELGQLALLLVLLPLLFLLSRKPWFISRFLPSATGLIASIAVYWVVARL
jgi:hypothetical protein